MACFAAGAVSGVASWSDHGFAVCKGEPPARLQSFSTHSHDINMDYEFGPQLGSGAYGHVFRGRCKATGKVVAIKALMSISASLPFAMVFALLAMSSQI